MNTFDTTKHSEELPPDHTTQAELVEDVRMFMCVVQQDNPQSQYNFIRKVHLAPTGLTAATKMATDIQEKTEAPVRVAVVEPNVLLQMTIQQGLRASDIYTKSGKLLCSLRSPHSNKVAGDMVRRHEIDIHKVRRRVEEKLRNSGPASTLCAAALLGVHVD